MCELRSEELYESKSSLQLQTQLLRFLKEEIILHSAVRVFHKFPIISQKVAQETTKSCFCNESCSKKQKLFGLILKYALKQK